MWAGAAAVTLGVLVAAATGGVTPPWWLVIIVALPATITLVLHYSHRAAIGTMRHRVGAHPRGGGHRVEPDGTPAVGTSASEADWETVSKVYHALDSRQVAWLRSSGFVTPWLDSNARRAIDIDPLVAEVVDGSLESDLSAALRTLADALKAFVGVYAESTFPDPLLLGEDWRFFHRDDPAGTDELDTEDDWWAEQAAQLHLLANELADAYEGFTEVAARYPKVRSRINVQV